LWSRVALRTDATTTTTTSTATTSSDDGTVPAPPSLSILEELTGVAVTCRRHEERRILCGGHRSGRHLHLPDDQHVEVVGCRTRLDDLDEGVVEDDRRLTIDACAFQVVRRRSQDHIERAVARRRRDRDVFGEPHRRPSGRQTDTSGDRDRD